MRQRKTAHFRVRCGALTAPAVAPLLILVATASCAHPSTTRPPTSYARVYAPARSSPFSPARFAQTVDGVPCRTSEVAPGVRVSFQCARSVPLASRKLSFGRRDGAVFTSGATLPSSIDHRADGTEGPVRDQQATGTCWAMALASAMDHQIRRAGRDDSISIMHIWSTHSVPIGQALTVEPTWKYNPVDACRISSFHDPCTQTYGVKEGTGDADPRIISDRARADHDTRWVLADVRDLPAGPDIAETIAATLAAGDDVWVDLQIDPDAWSASPQNPIVRDYEVRGDEHHSVLLAGYRSTQNGRLFLIHNSWSTQWADGGYGWISQAMVARYAIGAKTVRASSVSAPPQPTDCANGGVRDPVLGLCVSCASGMSPIAGICVPQGVPLPLPALHCANGAPRFGELCVPGL